MPTTLLETGCRRPQWGDDDVCVRHFRATGAGVNDRNPGSAAVRSVFPEPGSSGQHTRVTDIYGPLMSRHDYLPFGEEIPGGYAGRPTSAPFGNNADGVGEKFSAQIRDGESNLDYFNARYYASVLGRFTSPDPANAGADPSDPQTWNGYAYVRNNPLALVDPSGMSSVVFDGAANTITVVPSDPNEPTASFCAANNVAKDNTIGSLVDGTYPFLDTSSAHHHSPAEDSHNGPFGPGGIFRLVNFVGADGKVHTGVGLHAGRANKGGYTWWTNGCIRTTEPAISYLTSLAAHDPLTTLTVINNRKPTKAPVRTSLSSTIQYGPVLGYYYDDPSDSTNTPSSSDSGTPTLTLTYGMAPSGGGTTSSGPDRSPNQDDDN
jgi:RHS repeat-associated protein